MTKAQLSLLEDTEAGTVADTVDSYTRKKLKSSYEDAVSFYLSPIVGLYSLSMLITSSTSLVIY